MKTAGIIVNTTRLREQPEMAAQVRTTIDTLRRHGGTVWLDVDGARMLGVDDQGRPDDELAARAEIVIALGGGGTLPPGGQPGAPRGNSILRGNPGGVRFFAGNFAGE